MKKERVVIIGSGPAGHTAAIYAGRAMLEPLMFEGFMAGGVAAGGQLTTTTDVENFPGFPDGVAGPALMVAMRQQSLNSGARIETKTVDRVDLSQRPYRVYAGKMEVETDSIIIATGATAKRLGLVGEETYWQRGVSACAVCDGALPLFRDRHLIVIGGGDSACEEAHYLTKYANKVTMLVRRGEMRASKVMQERVLVDDKIEVMWHTEGQEIVGDGRLMTGLRVINNQSNEEQLLDAGGLFYAIGHKPATAFLDGQLNLDEAGYIMTYGRLAHQHVDGSVVLSPEKLAELSGQHHFVTGTSVPGVFACGDVQDKVYRQAITSAGTGCMAALEAEHYLQGLE